MGRDTRAEWKKRVARWKDSGLTAKEYAAEIGVKPATLQHWKWRIGSEARSEGSTPPSSDDSAQFVELVTPGPGEVSILESTPCGQPSPSPLELVFPDGLRLRVPPFFDAESLRRVLSAIEGR